MTLVYGRQGYPLESCLFFVLECFCLLLILHSVTLKCFSLYLIIAHFCRFVKTIISMTDGMSIVFDYDDRKEKAPLGAYL